MGDASHFVAAVLGQERMTGPCSGGRSAFCSTSGLQAGFVVGPLRVPVEVVRLHVAEGAG
jgi:hypothetical protein